jgi:flagellar basal-body rod protein FlgB
MEFMKFLILVAFFTSVSFASDYDVSNRNADIKERLKNRLEALSFRHEVLTKNIANVNTPGYKADEVEIGGVDGAKKYRIKMYKTSMRHIAGNVEQNSKFSTVKLSDPLEVKKNGNNVSLQQQVTKISQNDTEYSGSLKAYQSLNALIPTVLGK